MVKIAPSMYFGSKTVYAEIYLNHYLIISAYFGSNSLHSKFFLKNKYGISQQF